MGTPDGGIRELGMSAHHMTQHKSLAMREIRDYTTGIRSYDKNRVIRGFL